MNWVSIISLVSSISSGLYNLVAEVDPKLLDHNRKTIASATATLHEAGVIAPTVAAVVSTAANTAAAIDPKSATAATDIAGATSAIASALNTLTSAAAASKAS